MSVAPPRIVSDADANHAFDELVQLVGADDATGLAHALSAGRDSVPDSEMCWALTVLYQRVPDELPQPQAAMILRVTRQSD